MKVVFSIATLLLSIITARSRAQSLPALTRMPGGSCTRCTLALSAVGVAGRADDKELVPEYSMPAIPVAEKIFVSDVMGRQPILVYGPTGAFLGTLGTLGDGPGEYRGVQSIARARGDSILVYRAPRAAVISTKTGRGRSVPLPASLLSFRVLSLDAGKILIQNYGDRDSAFVVLSASGDRIRGFGGIAGKYDVGGGRMVGDYDAQQYVIAKASSGGFWSATLNYRYLLQQWSDDGRLKQAIASPAAWYKPYAVKEKEEHDRLGIGAAIPNPRIMGLWADNAGHLFVVTRVADAHWRPDPAAPEPRKSADGSPQPKLLQRIDRYVDEIFEVYDEKSGRLLGSWRSDDMLGSFTEAGFLVNPVQDPDGVKSFVIRRLVFAEK